MNEPVIYTPGFKSLPYFTAVPVVNRWHELHHLDSRPASISFDPGAWLMVKYKYGCIKLASSSLFTSRPKRQLRKCIVRLYRRDRAYQNMSMRKKVRAIRYITRAVMEGCAL